MGCVVGCRWSSLCVGEGWWQWCHLLWKWTAGGVERKDSWPLQVNCSTNRKEAVPQVLAEQADTVSLPGGERRMAICPSACPFTACLTALALRECCDRLDWTGLAWASIGKGATLCVCSAPSTLRQTRSRTRWTASNPVSQSATARDAAALCCVASLLMFPHCARGYLDALLFFPRS